MKSIRAFAVAFPFLVVALCLLLLSERFLSTYKNPSGLLHLIVFPPIEPPFFLYPVAGLVGVTVAVRKKSLTVIWGTQLCLLLAGFYFTNSMREQAESIAVLFIPAYAAATAHAVAWSGYFLALAAGFIVSSPKNPPPNQ